MVKVDVFVSRRRHWDDEAQERATEHPLGEGARPIRVASAEDVVVSKLAWFEAGGRVSERQWADVQGVLGASGETFDEAYARRAARSLGIADLLEAALRERSKGSSAVQPLGRPSQVDAEKKPPRSVRPYGSSWVVTSICAHSSIASGG